MRLLEDQGTVDVAGITGSVLTVDLLGDKRHVYVPVRGLLVRYHGDVVPLHDGYAAPLERVAVAEDGQTDVWYGRGVDECDMIRNLSKGLQRGIKYHLCLCTVCEDPQEKGYHAQRKTSSG